MLRLLTLTFALLASLIVFTTEIAFASPSAINPVKTSAPVNLPATPIQSKRDTNQSNSNISQSKNHSSGSNKSGNCDYPDQLDSAGKRCGKRAASVRMGGRLGGEK